MILSSDISNHFTEISKFKNVNLDFSGVQRPFSIKEVPRRQQ
jgi:hypothetical protein